MSGIVRGKALMMVERQPATRGGPWRFDLSVTILTCSSPDWAVRDSLMEDFSCCQYAIHPVPDACYRIAVGWRLTIKVIYEVQWGRDYWGEGWSDLQYLKERVIRRRPPIEYRLP